MTSCYTRSAAWLSYRKYRINRKQHKIGSWLKLMESASGNTRHCTCPNAFGMKNCTIKRQRLFSRPCFSPYSLCWLPCTNRRAPGLAARSRTRLSCRARVLLEIHRRLSFSFTFPAFKGETYLVQHKSFSSCKKCVTNNFCPFECNSFCLESGSEIPVVRCSEKGNFPTKFLCLENKREGKGYALNTTAVFKNYFLATLNTAEL